MSDFDNFVRNCSTIRGRSQSTLDGALRGRYNNAGSYIDGILDQSMWSGMNLREVAKSITTRDADIAIGPICDLFEALDMIIQSQLAFESDLKLHQTQEGERASRNDFTKAVECIGTSIAGIFAQFNEISRDTFNEIMTSLQGLRNSRLVQNAIKPYLGKTPLQVKGEAVGIENDTRQALIQASSQRRTLGS